MSVYYSLFVLINNCQQFQCWEHSFYNNKLRFKYNFSVADTGKCLLKQINFIFVLYFYCFALLYKSSFYVCRFIENYTNNLIYFI